MAAPRRGRSGNGAATSTIDWLPQPAMNASRRSPRSGLKPADRMDARLLAGDEAADAQPALACFATHPNRTRTGDAAAELDRANHEQCADGHCHQRTPKLLRVDPTRIIVRFPVVSVKHARAGDQLSAFEATRRHRQELQPGADPESDTAQQHAAPIVVSLELVPRRTRDTVDGTQDGRPLALEARLPARRLLGTRRTDQRDQRGPESEHRSPHDASLSPSTRC